MKLVLYGRPITKKNSQRIVKAGRFSKILPSKQFVEYEKSCLEQLKIHNKPTLNKQYNMKCIYYMPTRHRVDLVNLLEGTCDILVNAEVIEDDNCKIIGSHDGSKVLYDKENPRVEVEFEEIKIESEYYN